MQDLTPALEAMLKRTRWDVYDDWRDDQDPAQYEIEVYWLVRET